jgi:alpha-tubulin suppressor-like RCC1 family protein
MARLSRRFTITIATAMSSAGAAVLVAGCTQLLGADWDGRAPETSDGGGSTPGDGAGDPDARGDATKDAVSPSDGGAFILRRSLGLGGAHSCAVDDLGRVHCWGDNAFAQAGLPVGPTPFVESSRIVSTPEPLRAAAGGFFSNCVLATSGAVHCWGGNASGELGRTLPNKTLTEVPGLVQGLTEPAIALAARSDYACAVLLSGKVACWGRQAPTFNVSDRPVLVQGVNDVATIGVGDGHMCVVHKKDGSVACWGKNDKRQLGTDGVPSSEAALAVTLPGPAVDVVAGNEFSCALLATGAVHCWGDDEYGQLGPAGGPGTPSATPVAVSGISDARAIAAGDEHTCVATQRGTVVCWGSDEDGRLGGASLDGGTVEVFGLSGPADQVGAGKRHSCAMLGDAAPMCWGSNERGQLGSGNRLQQGPAPRTVAGW